MKALRDQENNIDLLNNIGQFVSMMPQIKMTNSISIVGLSHDFVAIYGASLEQEGAFLIIYNTKFHIVQATQFFKVYFNNSRLWVMDNNIYLGIGQMLSLVPFTILKEQLADLLGSQKVTGLGNQVDKEYMNEDYEIEESISFDKIGQVHLNQTENLLEDPEIDEKIVKLGNNESRFFESIHETNQKLHTLYNFDILIDVLRDENGLQDSIIPKLSSNPRNTSFMSEKFEIFSSELEKYGASEMEIGEKIIPIIIEADASQDLIVCLQRYTIASEKMIVKSLVFAINKIISTEINFENNSNDYRLINQILSCTYDRDEMLPNLRSQFDISTTVFLLNYLNEFYKNSDCLLEELPIHGDSFDSDMHVIEWMNIVIDSQYQKLILSSDSRMLQLLIDIQSTIDSSIEDVKTLSKFLPELHNLVNGKQVQTKNKYSKWYTIENVKLY